MFERNGEVLGSVKVDDLPEKAKKEFVKERDEANEVTPEIAESAKADKNRMSAGPGSAGGAAAAGTGKSSSSK